MCIEQKFQKRFSRLVKEKGTQPELGTAIGRGKARKKRKGSGFYRKPGRKKEIYLKVTRGKETAIDYTNTQALRVFSVSRTRKERKGRGGERGLSCHSTGEGGKRERKKV